MELMTLMVPMIPSPAAGLLVVDDFARDDGRSLLGTSWRLVTDRVMGGLSSGRLCVGEQYDRRALCLSGKVSLANNGGFVQVILDLDSNGTLDVSGLSGLYLVARGNGQDYNVHLKTPETVLPWQSYRAGFHASDEWREVRLPFHGFKPHRLETPLDTHRLSRIAIVAIGRPMAAEVYLSGVGFY